MSADLSTTYLGLKLKNPLVVSSCSLTSDLEQLRRLEDDGAAAAVLPSLFEEQVEHDAEEIIKAEEYGTYSYREALTYFPEQADYRFGPEQYLETIAAAKRAVKIPIIASLNGSNRGGWIRYARMMQDVGADAIELNIYFVAADPNVSGRDVEKRYVDLVSAVKQSIQVPLAVKIGPYFSSMAEMAMRLADAGADGLVLFNRFFQPDIDLEEMEARPRLQLSSPVELLLPLRWLAVLRGRIDVSLAASSGIHNAFGLLKALAAGADVGMVASAFYSNGPGYTATILRGMQRWLDEREYASVDQFRGCMSYEKCPDPSAFHRGNYMKTLTSYAGRPI